MSASGYNFNPLAIPFPAVEIIVIFALDTQTNILRLAYENFV
jgi:hypothetical protein